MLRVRPRGLVFFEKGGLWFSIPCFFLSFGSWSGRSESGLRWLLWVLLLLWVWLLLLCPWYCPLAHRTSLVDVGEREGKLFL